MKLIYLAESEVKDAYDFTFSYFRNGDALSWRKGIEFEIKGIISPEKFSDDSFKVILKLSATDKSEFIDVTKYAAQYVWIYTTGEEEIFIPSELADIKTMTTLKLVTRYYDLLPELIQAIKKNIIPRIEK